MNTGRTALSRGRSPRKEEPKESKLRSDDEIDSASRELARAMALCGLAAGENLQCWECGTIKKKKVVIRADKRYIKCYRCGAYKGAIKLVQEFVTGGNFGEAVDLLNGNERIKDDPDRAKRLAEMAKKAEEMASNSFAATLSPETIAVYNAVLTSEHSSVEEAAKYYGEWYISREAVEKVGFVYITNPDGLARELLSVFGQELIIASGLAAEVEEGGWDPSGLGIRWMFSANYPVVEPQKSPRGACHSMQFRPSKAQKAKVTAHKSGTGKYVPPFMSLRGAGPDHLVGIGLSYLCALAPSRVDIVEGAKDVAADLTLGNNAFGLPGTGVMPPAKSVRALEQAGHRLRVCMDGDEAGIAAQDKVIAHFIENGFPEDRIAKHAMPPGKDVADILVARHQG